MNLNRVHIFLGICIFLSFESVKGQSCVNFLTTGLDQDTLTAGCIPNMIIQFVDLSTCGPYRTTPYFSHTWKFGDQNNTISHVREPVFGYFDPGTYNITLVVTADGVNYDSVTHSIIVYDPPVPDMVPSTDSGCDPLDVCFTDLSTSANSTVTDWVWDFGDGAISRQQNPCHTFNLIPQQNCFSVTLQVINSRGCSATETFDNAVCVDLPPVASFTPSATLFCSRPFNVSFDNTSQSVNNLAYIWDFGDSTTSNQFEPTHTYTRDGIFTVTLTVIDTECSDTAVTTRTVTTRTVDANFIATSTVICAGTPAQFYDDGSIGQIVSYSWTFGDGTPGSGPNTSHSYANPGTYTVSLTVTDPSGCSNTETRVDYITVLPRPTVDFTADSTSSCKAPLTVRFTSSTSATNASYAWDFGNGIDTTVANPVYSYPSPGNFNVTLEVTDLNTGCTNVITKNSFITIQPRTVAFAMDVKQGCTPLTVEFTDASVGNPPFTIFDWDFGDSINGSTLQNPIHTYVDTGKYIIEFTAATAGYQCFATITDSVFVGMKLIPEFSIDESPACAGEEVNFINNTDYSAINDTNTIRWEWDFGGTSNIRNPPSQVYDEPEDSIPITLTVCHNGCCADTTLKLEILDPKAKFSLSQSCLNPSRVILTDSSEGANLTKWFFGDGDSLIMPPIPYRDTVHHFYASSGIYTIKLVTEDTITGCQTEQTLTTEISVTRADFDADVTFLCTGDIVTFEDLSVGSIPVNGGYSWSFGDGQTSGQQEPSHSYSQPGNYTVSLTVTDVNGCSDAEVKNAFIRVSGVVADFYSDNPRGCVPPTGTGNTITFIDNSVPAAGSNIISYRWNTEISTPTYPTPQLVVETYNMEGLYDISLIVETNLGCKDTAIKAAYVDIRKPEACIDMPFGLYCVDQPVQFFNCTQARGTITYEWEFGDGQTATGYAPANIYADTGCYDVTMRLVDDVGCRDTAFFNNICITEPFIDFIADDTESVCPPHLACFTNLSFLTTIPIKSVLWDFGDGSFSTLLDPCHFYTRAGRFTVTLYVEFENGCLGSATDTAYIFVGGAIGNITIDPDTGCIPMDIILDANSVGARSHYWITPWDTNSQGRLGGDTIHSVAEIPGFWTAAVVLTDTQSPPCSYVLYADIDFAADTVYSKFGTIKDTVCREDPVQFFDSSTALIDTHIVRWEWDFDDGSQPPPDTVKNPIHAFISTGPKNVCLTAYNSFGCSSTYCMTIYVRDKPNAAFTVSDDSGCDSLLVNFFEASTPGATSPITQWYWDFGVININGDTSRLQNPPPYYYSDTGIYNPYLVVTDRDGCDDTATVQVGVYKTPDGILSPDTIQMCEGDTVRLLSDSIYAAYQWNPDDYLSSAFVPNPFAFPQDTISYSLIITEAHGCHKIDTVTLNVVPLPQLTLTPFPDTAICYGDTIQLNATGGLSYVWGPDGYLSNRFIANPLTEPPPQSSITYTVTAFGIGGCDISRSVNVTVSRLQANFIGERSCFGSLTDFVDLSSFTELPLAGWTWDFGDVVAGDNSNLRNPAYTYSNADTFMAQLVVNDAIGCTDTVTQPIIIDTPATAVAGFDTTICLGECVQLFSSGGDTVFWTPNVDIDNPNIFTPVVCPQGDEIYIAYITNGVCPYDTAAVNITVMPPPDIQTIDDTKILKGMTIQLITSVDRYDSLSWTPADSLSCSNCLSPEASPDVPTIYKIEAFDEFGCYNFKEVEINVTIECEEDQIWVANAFTPNGDGFNPKVYARLIGLQQMNYFKIFDRWGKLMFETKDVNEGWDGKNLDGQQLNTGVYVYVCEAVCWRRQTLVKSGNITLIK